MSKPLHKKVDTPGAEDDTDDEVDRTEQKLRHLLSSLERHQETIQERIEEIRAVLDGKSPDMLATYENRDVPPLTVPAGRTLEAISDLQRGAGHVYALCAEVERRNHKNH